jgi:chemotaxis protein methyltransferase CheR
MNKVTLNEFKMIAAYIYEISGIDLDQSKVYLIETRLAHLLKETGIRSYIELYHKAKTDPSRTLERKIIDAICTHETMFFRDQSPFELLKSRILPELTEQKASSSNRLPANISIWSAGCSTGQEIYSIAIVLKEFRLSPVKYNIRLLGTDISDAALSCAASGEYSQMSVDRGLPQDKRDKYFRQNGLKWKIRDDIRAMCSFKKHNLMNPFDELGVFDLVFFRNVAIYFRQEDKIELFKKLADVFKPGGYLIIGSSESISGINSKFEPVTHANMIYYQLKK